MESEDKHHWYAEVREQALGPLTLDQVEELIRRQDLRADSLVWNASMTDWQPLKDSALVGLLPSLEVQQAVTPSRDAKHLKKTTLKSRPVNGPEEVTKLLIGSVALIPFFPPLVFLLFIAGNAFSIRAYQRANEIFKEGVASGAKKPEHIGRRVAIAGIALFGLLPLSFVLYFFLMEFL